MLTSLVTSNAVILNLLASLPVYSVTWFTSSYPARPLPTGPTGTGKERPPNALCAARPKCLSSRDTRLGFASSGSPDGERLVHMASNIRAELM